MFCLSAKPGYLKWEPLDVSTHPVGNSEQQQNTNGDPERPHQCPRCFKKYMQYSTLKRHMNLECGISPRFQCPHCPHKAKRNDELGKHIFRKHILKGIVQPP